MNAPTLMYDPDVPGDAERVLEAVDRYSQGGTAVLVHAIRGTGPTPRTFVDRHGVRTADHVGGPDGECWFYDPQPDITPLELARLIPWMECHSSLGRLKARCGDAVLRHFKKWSPS